MERLSRITAVLSRAVRAPFRLKAPRSLAVWFLAAACGLVIASVLLAASASLRSFTMRSLLMVTNTLPPRDADGRTNILLLGVGDASHDGPDLTDTIMLASIDPSGVSLLSIPRDLYLEDAPDAAPGRINSLYAQYKFRAEREGKNPSATGASLAGMRALADELGRRLGVDIQGVAKIDFSGFEQAVDAVGGIDIDVPEAIDDYSYPVEEGKIGEFHVPAGPQHFDGKTALMYARSRHSTSDFDRSARQQLVLKAFGRKVGGIRLLTDPSAMSAIQELLRHHFESTLNARELIGLAGIAVSADTERVVRLSLNLDIGGDEYPARAGGLLTEPADTASGAFLYPYSLTGEIGDWGQLRTAAGLLVRHREALAAHDGITVVHAGASPVQARRLTNELLRYGFDVAKPFGSTQKADHSSVRVIGGWHPSGELLAGVLGLPLEREDVQSGSGAVTIVLAKGYEFTPLQTLIDAKRAK